MTRVQYALLVLSLATFQGCTTASKKTADTVSATTMTVSPLSSAPSKIVRFADSLGAVSFAKEDAKLQSMIAAFDYCDREQRLAFVTPPLSYSPRVNYSRISTYSNRFESDVSAHAFVAPFECIDQKHSVRTGMLESEDVPSASEVRAAMEDSRGGVIVHAVSADSKFAVDDIVVRVGDYRVENRAELIKAVDISTVGDVSFTVVRKGKVVVFGGTVIDNTATVNSNALKLLTALCKETGSTSPSCNRHVNLSAKN